MIETGRMSPAICHGLRALGIPIVCIDARQAHQSLKVLKANKTDPHDAASLAQLARTGFYKEVYVKSPAAHGVRSVITARNHLVEAPVRLDNMIRGLCATFGFKPGPGHGKAFIDRVMEAANVPGLGQSIGDGDAMGVAAEIGEHLFRPAERWFGVDDPFEATDFGEHAGEGIRLCQAGEIAEEAQPSRIMGHSQFLQEAATKQARQHAHGQKEARPARDPACAVGRDATARHDAMQAGMVGESLAPTV